MCKCNAYKANSDLYDSECDDYIEFSSSIGTPKELAEQKYSK
jgi:hypothetical protein